jgi:hypothetical protein
MFGPSPSVWARRRHDRWHTHRRRCHRTARAHQGEWCAGDTVFDAACKWLNSAENKLKWKQWLPVEGCPAGNYRLHGEGLTLSCRECAAGFFSHGGVEPSCTPCAAGEFQQNTGKSACMSCDDLGALGDFYQERSGQTSCDATPVQSTRRGSLDS